MEGSHSIESSKTIRPKWSSVMMLQQFHNVTTELVTVLQDQTIIERDDRIDRIKELLDQREEFLLQIKPPFSAEELQLGRQSMLLNQQVNQLLLLQKQEIQRDIKELIQKKKTSNKYTNPYETLATDGMFYDKKN
ncbi:flagellar protein FliT [Peribacillus sp. NPDC097675]|uniref:flagellar protein FliT n=1 Tax=Peribacillus sp. NPDC097675 TaxID=3390618 RepID=UPI003CFF5B76